MNTLHLGLSRYYSKEQLNKIGATRVFIAGCGGLGSNVAHLLVRSGFINLTLMDYDTVEPSNLNRQFFFPDQVGLEKTRALAENLLRLNPRLNLNLISKKFDDSFDPSKTYVESHVYKDNTPSYTFKEYEHLNKGTDILQDQDIYVEAFDSPESKALFVSSTLPMGKPVICASGIAGYGNTDNISVKYRRPNLYIVGDGKTGIDTHPPLAPRVNVAAAKQADLVLTLTLDAK